eukprot:TRINITY_DN26900_c0_g1_i1.p1 TRINITY_DN26900_c0_g1~~TRINITY_DN26900_c0_g1_i1.p1  ORF type:complete len:466 (-),score=108.44 TRINITY_DN26900_c0_g1_i1:80-1477(-)
MNQPSGGNTMAEASTMQEEEDAATEGEEEEEASCSDVEMEDVETAEDEEEGEEESEEKTDQEVSQLDAMDEGTDDEDIDDQQQESEEGSEEEVMGIPLQTAQGENRQEEDAGEPAERTVEAGEDRWQESQSDGRKSELEYYSEPEEEKHEVEGQQDDLGGETHEQIVTQQPECQPNAESQTQQTHASSYLRHTVRQGDEVVIIDPSTGLLGQMAFVHCVLGPKQLECILRGGESRLLRRGQVRLRGGIEENNVVPSLKQRILLWGLNGDREACDAVKLADASLASEACLSTAASTAQQRRAAPARVSKATEACLSIATSAPRQRRSTEACLPTATRACSSRTRTSNRNPLPFEKRSMCFAGSKPQERTSFDLVGDILDKHMRSQPKDDAVDRDKVVFGTPDPKLASTATATTPVQHVAAPKRKAHARQLKSPALRKLAQAVDAEIGMAAPRYVGQGPATCKRRRL